MELASTVKQKRHHKIFVIQHVISHFDTYLTTDYLKHIKIIIKDFIP